MYVITEAWPTQLFARISPITNVLIRAEKPRLITKPAPQPDLMRAGDRMWTVLHHVATEDGKWGVQGGGDTGLMIHVINQWDIFQHFTLM